MTIIRRFECALAKTKAQVTAQYKASPNFPPKAYYKLSGYQFYCTSDYDLAELCNDPDHIASNFKSYINGFSENVRELLAELEITKHIDKILAVIAAIIILACVIAWPAIFPENG